MILTLVVAAVASWVLTGLLRRYALKRNVLDIPNERSSHTLPTPRGGGVSFVLIFIAFAAFSYVWMPTFLPGQNLWLFLVAALIVALTGFIDDHRPLPARYRLIGHFAGALLVLWATNGLPPIVFGNTTINVGAWGWVPGALYLVWLLNLYNFMDGIDGLASIEALCIAGGGALLYALLGHTHFLWLPLLLSACVLGFLIWNFPPAKIFMGDAGSGFLGITLGALSLQAGHVDPSLFYSWIILAGVFITDATLALFRRLMRGDKVYQAHRSHAYQHAARKLKSHKQVTLSVLAINVFWLLPLATLVALGYTHGLTTTFVAFLPLAITAWTMGSGVPDPKTSQNTSLFSSTKP